MILGMILGVLFLLLGIVIGAVLVMVGYSKAKDDE